MKSVILVGILAVLAGMMSFGIMVGYTSNVTGYGALSLGMELNQTTFVYAGISFPLGAAVGGGMKMGKIFETNLGKTKSGKNVGYFKISWGGVANADVNFSGTIGVFGGPALLFDWSSDFIEGDVFWYTALGLSVFNAPPYLSLDGSSGIFYKF